MGTITKEEIFGSYLQIGELCEGFFTARLETFIRPITCVDSVAKQNVMTNINLKFTTRALQIRHVHKLRLKSHLVCCCKCESWRKEFSQ